MRLRTLNRLAIVATLCFAACTVVHSDSLVAEGFDPTKYEAVAIYDSESASFIELRLEKLFLSLGFDVVGELEASGYTEGEVLGVRYTEETVDGQASLIILLEDFRTDRTMATVSGTVANRSDNVSLAWETVQQELKQLLVSR